MRIGVCDAEQMHAKSAKSEMRTTYLNLIVNEVLQ